MLNQECGWKDGDRSAVNLRGRTCDKQDDDQLNCLGKTNSPLTPTGLLMEGSIRNVRHRLYRTERQAVRASAGKSTPGAGGG
jgi:hypothetical protein